MLLDSIEGADRILRPGSFDFILNKNHRTRADYVEDMVFAMSPIRSGLHIAFPTYDAELAVTEISSVGQKDTKAQKWGLISVVAPEDVRDGCAPF